MERILPKPLITFFQDQKERYGELFWYEQREGKIVLMIEKLAEKARQVLAKEDINNVEIVSFERDDSIGYFFLVEEEQIDVETRPGKAEYRSIMDKDLKTAFTDQTNDIGLDQLVRVYRPGGYKDYCVVAYHSFGAGVPRGPIGRLKNLIGLRKVGGKEFVKPEKLISFEKEVKGLEGVKYRMGGASVKNGFDCSSLVQRIFFETKGVWLPRKARWQQMTCDKIGQKDLQQGDLAFFNRIDPKENDGVDHVALVWEVKPGKLPIIFHAKKLNGKSVMEDLNNAKWLDVPNGWGINSFGRVRI